MNSETRDSDETPKRDTNSVPEREVADPDPNVDAPVWPEMMERSEADEFNLPLEKEVDEQNDHEKTNDRD